MSSITSKAATIEFDEQMAGMILPTRDLPSYLVKLVYSEVKGMPKQYARKLLALITSLTCRSSSFSKA